ncbi:hypothetical protein RHMOL_Rhmol12G0014200 [Rhododendron molle]|uniref:Uncharacterized protein n=1 Tax=Rhododendron molle TaxID=49168 RepID=A0ACC0LEW5_RHOML|nr:hypothetical protein RHMOL_Rhmol12G0014200 [Rhododendron molle]
MEMGPPSPMLNELVMMVWYGESCVEEEMGGGMVVFVGNGSDESQLYHHGALSIHDDETTYGSMTTCNVVFILFRYMDRL